MPRRILFGSLLVLATALATAPEAVAEPLQEIATELQAEGYRIVEVRRTWLGRIRIEAENGDLRREIVFDRVTGEIRRDLVQDTTTPGTTGLKGLGRLLRRDPATAPAKRNPAPGPKPTGKTRSGAEESEDAVGNEVGGGNGRRNAATGSTTALALPAKSRKAPRNWARFSQRP